MQNRRNFFEKCNTESIIPILSLVFYKENCLFLTEFSTNAYVFVFSIVTYDIEICLFGTATGS